MTAKSRYRILMVASRLWTACPWRASGRSTKDAICLRKKLGKAAGIYRAHGIVQVWWLSALSISNSNQPSGKQTGYPPYRGLQWNTQRTCCNPQGWISTDRARQLYNVTISQAPPSHADSPGSYRPVSNTGAGMGQAEDLGVSQHWSLFPLLTLDPSLADKSCNLLSPISPSLAPGRWCQRQRKALGNMWDDATLLCHFFNRFQDILTHCRGLTQSFFPPLILTSHLECFAFLPTFDVPFCFPSYCPKRLGRMVWFHKNLSRHNTLKCNIFWGFTSEHDPHGCKFSEKHWSRGSKHWRFFTTFWACRCQMAARALHPWESSLCPNTITHNKQVNLCQNPGISAVLALAFWFSDLLPYYLIYYI